MKIDISHTGVIKEQNIEFNKDVSIIYGYNNSGKTTILKVINDTFYGLAKKKFLLAKQYNVAVYIPTNRIILSTIRTENVFLKDFEDFINYHKDAYRDYSLHLKRIRDFLMPNIIVYNFVCTTVKRIFDIDTCDPSKRLSDGIENIINIYLSIIWSMVWDVNIHQLTEEQFVKIIQDKEEYILIDEIEMFLHVNIQSRLIESLKNDFPKCKFIFTTHSPLMLTRYKSACVYNIIDGCLEKIDMDLYYEDLDNVYESLFKVNEIPTEIRDDINYLGDVIMNYAYVDSERTNFIVEKLRKEYPNLSRKYNALLLKAQNIGEKND